jgi:hypothetical protein
MSQQAAAAAAAAGSCRSSLPLAAARQHNCWQTRKHQVSCIYIVTCKVKELLYKTLQNTHSGEVAVQTVFHVK